MSKGLKQILISILLLTLGILGISYYKYNKTVNVDTIYPGVKIDDFQVGGMSKTEAFSYLTGEIEKLNAHRRMDLSYGEKKISLSHEDLGLSYEIQKAIEKAYSLGRDKTYYSRYKDIKNMEKYGVGVSLETHLHKDRLKKLLADIAESINLEYKDATLTIKEGKINITDESDGLKVEEDKLMELIENNVYDFKPIDIPVKVIKAKYSKEYYCQINGVIGEASTGYASSIEGRKENIRLSAKALNGRLLHPKETLSYNDTLGPITKERGYKIASVIVNGEFVDGLGGGICQTSTTLYNALLEADLTITQRSPHSVPITYVAKGTDAAVAEGFKDLIFRNDFDFPIYISSRTNGDRVNFTIYGDRNIKDYQVRIEAKLIETIKHKVIENYKKDEEPGFRKLVQSGRDGYKVKTYKHKIRNNKVFNSEEISFDYYKEQNTIYNIGPPKQEPEAPSDGS